MRVKKIGNIDLEYMLWMIEDDKSTHVEATVKRTVDGGLVVYEQESRDVAQYITLESKSSGWLSKATKEAIVFDANNSIGSSTTITLEDDTVINVRYAHETKGGAVQFSPVYEGAGWFTAKIYFGRVA